MIEALQADQAMLFWNDLVSKTKRIRYKYSGSPVVAITKQARPNNACRSSSIETLSKINLANVLRKGLAYYRDLKKIVTAL